VKSPLPPAGERRKIGLKPRDKVAVDVQGDAIVIRPVDARHHRGIGATLYDETRDALDYVRELRAERGKRK
jgi:bifunctional DNA-binding transcriptional regulator/antitoxin component of YhaV-PrlF toxin-antitoxin module